MTFHSSPPPYPAAHHEPMPHHRPSHRVGLAALAAVLALAAAGCDGDPQPLAAPGAGIALELNRLPPLDAARDGSYAVWLVDAGGTHHAAGAIDPNAAMTSIVSPVPRPVAIEVTIEPPGDADPGPSAQRLLRGVFNRGMARLTVAGAVTVADLRLEPEPGQFTVMTISDNARNGYPSNEQAGVWLLNMRPRETRYNEQWARLTPLNDGWVYEGWIVRDYGRAGEAWLSYGKFAPDRFGSVSRRDQTGAGPFSGVPDFATAGTEEFPGDDWLENPLGLPLPAGLTLPLNLLERTAAGASRWTHVITIEPATDRGEPIGNERPSFLRPYRDAIGPAAPGIARTITYRTGELPAGIARATKR